MNQPEPIEIRPTPELTSVHNDSFFHGSKEGQPVQEVLQSHQQLAKRLYQLITDLAYQWNSFYEAASPEAKDQAQINIKLLEAERATILGQLVQL